MTRVSKLALALAAAAMLFATACGGGGDGGGKQIRTVAGKYRITAVTIAERWPPGCSSSGGKFPTADDCVIAKDGYQVLAMTMAPMAEVNDDDAISAGFRLLGQACCESSPEEAHLLHDGQRISFVQVVTTFPSANTTVTKSTWQDVRTTLITPIAAGAKNLQLVWPDNPPVDLTPLIKR